MRQVLFIAIWLFLPLVVHAQHVNSWGRLTVKNNVNKRWSAEEEFQLRRQSYKDYNLFHYPLMYSFRWFVNYKVNDNIQIVLSPFACFHHSSVITENEMTRVTEYRFTIAAVGKKNIATSLQLYNRPAAEYRMFQFKEDNLRFRDQIGLRYLFTKNTALKVFDDVMLHYFLKQKEVTFDQNRIGISLMYSFSSRIELETGYMHIVRRSTANDENAFMNFSVALF